MRYKRIGFKRLAKFAAIAVVLALAATQLVHTIAPAPTVGHWRSTSDRERYATAYSQVLGTLPAADEIRDVPTSFGIARVLVWRGAEPGRPVLLVPGRASGAPMWAENLPSWIGKRTVYAVDPIGDAGFSAQHTPMTSASDQARWIADVIQALKVAPVHLVGHSFGGATAAQVAVEHPKLVATLALEEPVIVIEPMPATVYLWSAVLLLPTPQDWKDRALAEIGGTTIEQVRERTPMSLMIDAASSGYSAELPMPATLTDEQWKSLSMPVRVDIGGASALAGGQKGADRVRALLPGAQVRVWPDATHSLPMDRHAELGPDLAEFWRKH